MKIFDTLTRNHKKNSIYFLQWYRRYDLSNNDDYIAFMIDTFIKCQKQSKLKLKLSFNLNEIDKSKDEDD